MNRRLTDITHYPPALSLAGLLLFDGLFFGLTNPRQLASFWLIGAFILLAATLYRLSRLSFKVLGWYGLRVKRPQKLAVTVTTIVTALLALQSIGELTARDILVTVPLVAILYAYLNWGGLRVPVDR